MAFIGPQVSNAQPNNLFCEQSEKIFSFLQNEFKEFPILSGVVGENSIAKMTLWVNKEKGTWTLLSSGPTMTCIVGAGSNFQMLDQTLEKEKKPSIDNNVTPKRVTPVYITK